MHVLFLDRRHWSMFTGVAQQGACHTPFAPERKSILLNISNIVYCSHEIKRCLLLGRKVMTNLDSILKSRDITLPTKVHLVKAMGVRVGL